MILYKRSNDLKSYFGKNKFSGKSVGFVPTMGALHEGHSSLIRRSKNENDLTCCSIFVNPAQFNDPADMEKYPRPIEKDLAALESAGCDVLFLPESKDIYPEGIAHLKRYDLGHLENILEGKSRPGHFQGVANVVHRLLNIVSPDRMYLGQKDFQQMKVLERLKNLESLPVEIIMCPIVREDGGLAFSSRNIRLSPEERNNAQVIFRTLQWVKEASVDQSLHSIRKEAIERINKTPGARVDYFECCDATGFTIIPSIGERKNTVFVTAVMFGEVRLLDNVLM